MDHTIIHHVLQATWFPQLHSDCWRIKKRYKYFMVHTRKSKVFESVLLFVSTRENPPQKKRGKSSTKRQITWFLPAFFWHGDWFDVFVEESNMNLGQLGSPKIAWLKDPVGHLTTLRRLEHMWKMATDRKGGLKSWAHKSHNIYLWTMCNLGGMPSLVFLILVSSHESTPDWSPW